MTRVVLATYWVALAIATHWPSIEIPTRVTHRDKIVHIAAFAVLSVLLVRAMRYQRMLLALAVLLAYAALDEYTQQFFGRYTDPLDFIANLIGIAIAMAILYHRRRTQREQRVI